jgi:transcriptional regulator with XRE-family HTH domain
MTAFGAVVRRRRCALGLSQQKLGERCGLTQEYISGIERGVRNPTLKSIWTLAGGLEVSPGDLLLEGEEIMDSET